MIFKKNEKYLVDLHLKGCAISSTLMEQRWANVLALATQISTRAQMSKWCRNRHFCRGVACVSPVVFKLGGEKEGNNQKRKDALREHLEWC